ncbi:MAG: hypothetical protein IIV90_04315, partial [Oscillospiraceae bacterium]|nr:hypothetical protein [Oscillospiraceae bacterium]
MELSAKRLCPECGAENEGTAFYCYRCRAFLRGLTAQPKAKREPAPPPRPDGERRPGGGFSPFDLGAARPRPADTPAPAQKTETREPAPPPPAKTE